MGQSAECSGGGEAEQGLNDLATSLDIAQALIERGEWKVAALHYQETLTATLVHIRTILTSALTLAREHKVLQEYTIQLQEQVIAHLQGEEWPDAALGMDSEREWRDLPDLLADEMYLLEWWPN